MNWRCGGSFALAGVMGALGGSTLGKAFDGEKLLFLFALLMLVVAVLMYRGRGDTGIEGVQCNRENLRKVVLFGIGTGILSGFFGIGGGFLIVPALVASTAMPIYRAIGTSLIAVAAFGLTTAATTPHRVCWTFRWPEPSSLAGSSARSSVRLRRSGWRGPMDC